MVGTPYTTRPQGSFVLGRYFNRASDDLSKREGSMKLLVRVAPVTGSFSARALPFDWHAADSSPLKSPAIAAAVGM